MEQSDFIKLTDTHRKLTIVSMLVFRSHNKAVQNLQPKSALRSDDDPRESKTSETDRKQSGIPGAAKNLQGKSVQWPNYDAREYNTLETDRKQSGIPKTPHHIIKRMLK